MLNYFKAYLDKIAEPVTAATILGASCGAVSGVVGLYQMCSGNDGSISLDLCSSQEPIIIPESRRAAAVTGAVAGAFVGFLAGSVVYPVYNGFIGWCRRDIEQRRQSEIYQQSEDVNLNIRVEIP